MYFRKRLLVVGGRNSAVESALRCWRSGTQVAISYRRAEFDAHSVKNSILPDVKTQIRKGNITFYPETVPIEITPEYVALAPVTHGELLDQKPVVHPADFVLLCTGFEGDMSLFKMAGVTLHGNEMVPEHNSETMETNVSGLYIAGTVAAGSQTRYRLFIENCHAHAGKITKAITGQWPAKLGTIDARRYELPLADIQTN